jgi:hypothetical protein
VPFIGQIYFLQLAAQAGAKSSWPLISQGIREGLAPASHAMTAPSQGGDWLWAGLTSLLRHLQVSWRGETSVGTPARRGEQTGYFMAYFFISRKTAISGLFCEISSVSAT